jgi:hypothetical protein
VLPWCFPDRIIEGAAERPPYKCNVGGDFLAVPARLELATFGLGMRCGGDHFVRWVFNAAQRNPT